MSINCGPLLIDEVDFLQGIL